MPHPEQHVGKRNREYESPLISRSSGQNRIPPREIGFGGVVAEFDTTILWLIISCVLRVISASLLL
jgi:hypothetical protein